MTISTEDNKIFIGGKEQLELWEDSIRLPKIRTLLKNYLELDNVSFLFGAGSSIILGSISIATIPKGFEDAIKSIPEKDEEFENSPYDEFIEIVKGLQKSDDIIRRGDNIDYPIEKLLNYLIAMEFIQSNSEELSDRIYIKEIIAVLKEELFKICDLEELEIRTDGLEAEDVAKMGRNKFLYHEKFTKKLLQRPLNLRRASVFTTNYDLAFDIAFDNLGVHYVNGFSGFHKRTFMPEIYDYDLYYPGNTTQGKVSRIEKVLKYYKIHGSLTWVQSEPDAKNVYGIEEWPIGLVRDKKAFERLMIYPSAAKKSYTLDFPYSELFRQFAATITQQQSVLITFGYSFSDEHINDIIYQALTIPTFTLIIIDFLGVENPEIERLNDLCDPRIVIIQGRDLGTFPFFVENSLPDFIEDNIQEKVAETLSKVYERARDVDDTEEL